MSKTLVPNAGLKRWPHSLAGAAEPMADHHPSGSNSESLQYDAVGFTKRLLWQPWFEPGPAPLSAIARACPNPLGGGNSRTEIRNMVSSFCVCVCVCVCGSFSCDFWFFSSFFLTFFETRILSRSCVVYRAPPQSELVVDWSTSMIVSR